MAVVTLTFFSLRESEKWILLSEEEDSIPYTDSTWSSENFVRSRSAPAGKETSPLLTPCSCQEKHNGFSAYGTNFPSRKLCIHNKRKSGYATVADGVAYFLKFQYITDAYIKIRKRSKPRRHTYPNTELYQDYLKKEKKVKKIDVDNNNLTPKRRDTVPKRSESYCEFLENTIFGSPTVLENIDDLTIKRNNKGIVAKLKCDDDERKPTDDIIRHNLEKIQFYEQTQPCMSMDDIFDGCECRDGVTYVRGTVTVSSTGACEV